MAITPGCITVIALTSSEYLCRAIFGRCYITQTVVSLVAALLISIKLIKHFKLKTHLCSML